MNDELRRRLKDYVQDSVKAVLDRVICDVVGDALDDFFTYGPGADASDVAEVLETISDTVSEALRSIRGY